MDDSYIAIQRDLRLAFYHAIREIHLQRSDPESWAYSELARTKAKEAAVATEKTPKRTPIQEIEYRLGRTFFQELSQAEVGDLLDIYHAGNLPSRPLRLEHPPHALEVWSINSRIIRWDYPTMADDDIGEFETSADDYNDPPTPIWVDPPANTPYELTDKGARYYGRQNLARQGNFHPTQDELEAAAAEYHNSIEVPKLELDLGDLEFRPNSSASGLPFPTMRISTVSGVVYLNNAFRYQLSRINPDKMPTHVKLFLSKDRNMLVVQFFHSYQVGSHVLGLGDRGNYAAGLRISCGSTLSLMAGRLAHQNPDAVPTSDPIYHQKWLGDARNWANDQLYGRRRASMVNSRLDLWAIDIRDPRV